MSAHIGLKHLAQCRGMLINHLGKRPCVPWQASTLSGPPNSTRTNHTCANIEELKLAPARGDSAVPLGQLGHPCQEKINPCVSRVHMGAGAVNVGKLPLKRCAGNGTDPTQNTTKRDALLKSTEAGWGIKFPEVNGTRAIDGWFWLCGSNMWPALPQNWSGGCGFVQLANHSYVIRHQNEMSRKKHDLNTPHDSIWGSNVPDDFKLWNTADKVILSLFPQFGVGKLILRAETINYRLSTLISPKTTRS